MATEIETLKNLPDIDFVNKDVDDLLADMVAEYQTAYQKSTGEAKTLASGDPVRIWIYAQALRIYTAYQLIDRAAKYNLLKYSSGGYLENLGARVGVTREKAASAIVIQRFTLSKTQSAAVAIPKGTRAGTSDNVFFTTTEYAEIAAGSAFVDVCAACTDTGTGGNGYTKGQINILIDPIQFVAVTENITTSQGGAAAEDDDSLRGRIFLRPESFSVAGPVRAYEYFVRDYNAAIADVRVTSPSPGAVNVCFILENGELPEADLCAKVQEFLSADTRRPLTDSVTVAAPETISFTVDIVYYIKKSDKASASTINAAVTAAVNEYITWQKSKIGRDINPSQLISMVMSAGASRVVVNSPAYAPIGNTEVAIATGVPRIVQSGEFADE